MSEFWLQWFVAMLSALNTKTYHLYHSLVVANVK